MSRPDEVSNSCNSISRSILGTSWITPVSGSNHAAPLAPFCAAVDSPPMSAVQFLGDNCELANLMRSNDSQITYAGIAQAMRINHMTDGFKVAFVFGGGLADQGQLDGSDYATSVQAARRLLALHAHFWATGKIPLSAHSESRFYHIRHIATGRGAHVSYWNVLINGKPEWTSIDVAEGAIASIAETKRTQQQVDVANASRLLRNSVRSAFGHWDGDLLQYLRTTPAFEAQAFDHHDPLFADEAVAGRQQIHLLDTTSRILFDLARPVGRCAVQLNIAIEKKLIATIDRDVKDYLFSQQVSEVARGLVQHDQATGLAPPPRPSIGLN